MRDVMVSQYRLFDESKGTLSLKTLRKHLTVPTATEIKEASRLLVNAVNGPLAAATTNQGSNGTTSRFHSMRPRSHQNTTSSAAGSDAVTAFVMNAQMNSAVANA